MRRTPHIFITLAGLSVFLLATVSITSTAFADTGTGFVTSPIWLMPATPKEGDMATLTAAFRNTNSVSISGAVSLYDGDVLLAKKTITIPAGGVSSASATFKVVAGDHSFSATMNSYSKAASGGKSEVVSLSNTTEKLPNQFVSKKIDLAADAAGNSGSASETPILNQIDKAEKSVLGVIPAPTKNAVANVVGKFDAWRASVGANFSANKTSEKATLDAPPKMKTIQADTVLGSKKVQVPDTAGTSITDRPIGYVKLFFFTVFAYLFTTPILFYLIAIVLLYLIIRFIVRGIKRVIAKSRKNHKKHIYLEV